MALLEPDRNQLEIFVQGLFRHCNGGGVVSLRTFFEDADVNDPPARIIATPLKGGLNFLIEAAEDEARRAAQHPRAAVFCPPVATFTSTKHAREIDLFEGPVLLVELDKNPRAALATLENLLGFATFVVRSGGTWTDPKTGTVEDKLHAYWRLKGPAHGKAALDKLKRLRRLATDLVGADPSSIPINHPIRWAGSWHRKAAPRLCEIVSPTSQVDNELDLDVALAALEAVSPPGAQTGAQTGTQIGTGPGGQATLDWDEAFGEIIRGEKFHPALTPLASSFAAHAVPEAAARGVLGALLTNTQTKDPARLRRRDTELAKLKDTVHSGYEKFTTTPTSGALFDPWQEFIVPPFPLDILPAVAHDFVETKSIAMGVDPSALAMAGLAAFSGAIHHRFRVKMMLNSDWYEHVRLWVLLFGRSSWLKSPIMDAVLWPLRYAQADVQREHNAAMRDWKANGGEEADKPEPPERYLVGDVTIEKLGEIMSRSDRGMLAEHDELAGWIGQMERYHGAGKGASTDRAFYLRCWNGGPYTIDRVKAGEILVPNASLSIIGGIQPKKLDELQGLTSDGLLQRFAVVFMQEPKAPQDIDCTTATKAYAALVYELLNLPGQRFSLTDAATVAMIELQQHLFSLERAGAAFSEAFASHIGKLKAYAGVFTIILHLTADPKGAMKLSAIGKPSVEKAARLIKEFLLPHAREFYARSESEGEQVRTIASYILTCGKDHLRPSDFANNVRYCRGKKVLEINQQVSPLVAGDWLVPLDPGPACRSWRANRAAIDHQFTARMATEQQSKAAIVKLLGSRRRK
jgi:Protein of unknown function (DUF3987)